MPWHGPWVKAPPGTGVGGGVASFYCESTRRRSWHLALPPDSPRQSSALGESDILIRPRSTRCLFAGLPRKAQAACGVGNQGGEWGPCHVGVISAVHQRHPIVLQLLTVTIAICAKAFAATCFVGAAQSGGGGKVAFNPSSFRAIPMIGLL